MIFPNGSNLKIIGQLGPNFSFQAVGAGRVASTGGLSNGVNSSNLSSPTNEKKPLNLKRKRSGHMEKGLTQEEMKKAAKRQRNRVLAQQSRDRKKKYVENLEKDHADMIKNREHYRQELEILEKQHEKVKSALLLSTKKSVVLCMLICVALLVVSQQTDDIPSRLAEVELPPGLPKDISVLDLITEQFVTNRSELEKDLSLALLPSIVESIALKATECGGVSSMDDPKSLATQHIVHEITQVMKAKDKLKDHRSLIVKSRRKGKSQNQIVDMIHAQNCDSEDSYEDNQQ